VETMPTLEEYKVEKAFIVFLRKEHYQEIVLVAKEFKKNLLKSKEEKED